VVLLSLKQTVSIHFIPPVPLYCTHNHSSIKEGKGEERKKEMNEERKRYSV
jgi:hypothetical protein